MPRHAALLALAALAAAGAPGPAAASPRTIPTAGHGVAQRATAGPPTKTTGHPIHRTLSPHPRALARAKDAARRRYLRAVRRRPLPRVRAKPLVFNGLVSTGIAQSSPSPPPDTTGAIGPTAYVEATNDTVQVFNRNTLAAGTSVPLDTFLGGGTLATDPQVIWDSQTSRFYFAGITQTGSNWSLRFGWSKSSDPGNLNGDWCHFAIGTGTNIPDFPKLGDWDGGIAIGVNTFNSGDSFLTGTVYAIGKPATGDASCASPGFASFGSPAQPLGVVTPVPANTTDGPANDYVVAADSASGGATNRLHVFQLSGTGASASLAQVGDIVVSSFSIPADAPQAGSGSTLDTFDSRLTQAVAHIDPAVGAEAVWTQHTVNGPAGRSVVRWYELLPATLGLRQQGGVGDPSSFAFNGAVSPTSNGADAMLDYSVSGASIHPQAWATSRKATAPAGQMSTPLPLVTSAGPLNDGSCGAPNFVCRWGDYAAATPDPSNPSLVWGTNEYAAATGGWLSRNFAIDVGGGPVASFAGTPSPALTHQNVVFDATSTTDTSGVPVTRFQWDLDGDGSFETDTGADPHALANYPSPRHVSVGLLVTDANGDQSVAARGVDVANSPPVALLTASTRKPPLRSNVAFDASRSGDVDGPLIDFRWDLDGNGTFETDTGTAPNAARTFTRKGPAKVGLQVADSAGATAQATLALTVGPSKKCAAARNKVAKLAKSRKKLKKQARRARGAKRVRTNQKLSRVQRQLTKARKQAKKACKRG